MKHRRSIYVLASTLIAGLMALGAGQVLAAQSLTNLGGWWRFNENTSTVINDSSANANNGAMSGGTWVAGKFGSGLEFGATGYVEVPSSPTLESQTITAEAWVKNSGSPGQFKYILAKGADGQTGGASYALYTAGSGGIAFYVLGTDCGFYLAHDTSVSFWDGAWHRVTGTYDGSTVRLYVDGALAASNSVNVTVQYNIGACFGASTSDLSSGTYLGGTQSSFTFPGAIDEPRVWTQTLSSTEVGDTTAPTVTISSLSPIPLGQASVSLSATATDPYGVVGGEYSLDGGAWTAMTQSDSTLSATIDTHALAVGTHQVQVRATDYADNTSQPETSNFSVIYSFSGFFQPVDNLPTLNTVKAGQGIPVKFSLGGNQGLNIFATGYPKSQEIQCDATEPTDGIEQTLTAGSSSLSYDPTANQYTYVWKTDKGWAGKCRQLVVKLNDGTTHQEANFKFMK